MILFSPLKKIYTPRDRILMKIEAMIMVQREIHKWIQEELFDLVPVNIAVINPEFHIIQANRAFTETYGSWQNRHCHEVYKDREDRCVQCGAAKSFKDGKIRIREEQGKLPNGKSTYYIVHMVPIERPDGSIPFIIEMSTDITEIKLLQQEKLEAERLAAVGETVAGLAHGIKNIMMGLEGGMYVVNSGIRHDNGKRIMQGWQMLEEDIQRISSFVREFLDFARGRIPQVSLIDPNTIARKVADLYKNTATLSNIEIIADLKDDIQKAALDEEGIHTCLTNLMSNALDACEMSQKKRCKVVISTREENGILIYEVRDNGSGIDYDIKQKVFTNFFSTKGSGKGTGLGLLTTRKIVQEHGGKVSFESTEGEGSVFRLEFPRERLPELTNGGKDK